METKGLNLRHRYVSSILGKGNIYKHSLFSAVPLFTIPEAFSEALTVTTLMVTKNDPNQPESERLGEEEFYHKIYLP